MTGVTSPSALERAKELDRQDELSAFRGEFLFPLTPSGEPYVYLTGNSLGLQPKKAQGYVLEELEDWAKLGVEGHFQARHPWFPYHEFLTEPMARVVGALPSEVVVMNSLTTNLHLMMVSFYRPTTERFRVLVLKSAFPSDRYAVESQVRLHGLKPEKAVLELAPRPGEETLRVDDILSLIEVEGKRLALVLFENVNYLTGQAFPMAEITAAAHRQGAIVGWDLAHGAGNLDVKLHDADVDFAVWCSYKYLNSGPGGVGGAFVHERHGKRSDLPKLAGWWGHDKIKRFEMAPQFSSMAGAEGWQLSNPPILQMAALRASLELFDGAKIERLRAKSEKLTGFLAELIGALPADKVRIVTPADPKARGAQLSLRLKGSDRSWVEWFRERGIVCDFRQPDVFRVAPAPLYCTFEDAARFYGALLEKISGGAP
jgi:kynureninase